MENGVKSIARNLPRSFNWTIAVTSCINIYEHWDVAGSTYVELVDQSVSQVNYIVRVLVI